MGYRSIMADDLKPDDIFALETEVFFDNRDFVAKATWLCVVSITPQDDGKLAMELITDDGSQIPIVLDKGAPCALYTE